MSAYNDRRWSATIDGDEFIAATTGRQFKCTFNILHDFGGFTSYADIAFYNLNANTANNAFRRNSILAFKAGYVDTIDTIFSGAIRNVLRERVGPDTITRVICRGGKLAEQRQQVNETLGVGATLSEVIRACATALEYPIVIDDSQFNEVTYPFGYTLQGDPKQYLDNLALTHRFDYVIENERLVVVKEGETRQGSVHVISQFTGMEGIPEITEVGADVRTRLNPKLRIGGRFRIESDLARFNFGNLYFRDVPESAGQGEYKIYRLNYTGDTWGDEWTNRITGIR